MATTISNNLIDGPKVLQVVTDTLVTTFTTTSTSFTDLTGLSASITPASTANKVLVIVMIGYADVSGGSARALFVIDRAGTDIAVGTGAGSRTPATSGIQPDNSDEGGPVNMSWLDSPSSSSSVTYKVQCAVNTGTLSINQTNSDANAAATGRFASSIILMEVEG
jgi:hypothetical protein